MTGLSAAGGELGHSKPTDGPTASGALAATDTAADPTVSADGRPVRFYARGMFNIGQQAAVRGAFQLAGYQGTLATLPIDDSPDERIFILDHSDLSRLRDLRILTQVLQQLLGCKVWVVEKRSDLPAAIPFE